MTTTKWSFDEGVTAVFDDMLKRSIPQYEEMRSLCLSVGTNYCQQHTDIVDLGASRGEAVQPFIDRFGAHNRFVLVEVSQPMLEVLGERFSGFIKSNLVRVLDDDLRNGYPPVNASVTLCILTLQFTPIEYRQRILRDIWTHTTPGGVLILVEKVLGGTAEIDKMLVKRYYGFKEKNGYTKDEIDRKRMALEGVLVPVTAKWNEELLKMAGFSQVDCFWRWMNFAGWVAVKA